MTNDRPMFGILLMFGFCLLAPLGDAFAKLLGNSIPLLQILFVRFGMQFLLLAPIIWMAKTKIQVNGWVFLMIALRTVLHIFSVGAMFISLRYLPLADAIAIAFVMPFIMLILAKTILGEEVGPRRIIACTIGFAGTLLVIQPSFANVGAPALYPLLVAVGYAFYMLVTRQIAKQTDPVSLQAISGFLATIILSAIYVSTKNYDLPDFNLVKPVSRDIMLLLSIGIIGTFAHLLMTWALRLAPSATLAPMQYLEIPVATLIGWMIFHDLPNGLASIGIAITILAGLYIVFREHMTTKAIPAGI